MWSKFAKFSIFFGPRRSRFSSATYRNSAIEIIPGFHFLSQLIATQNAFFSVRFRKNADFFGKSAISGKSTFPCDFPKTRLFRCDFCFFQFSVRFRKTTQFSAQFLKICFVDFRPRAERAGHAVLALNGRGTPAAGAACQELAGERGFAFS